MSKTHRDKNNSPSVSKSKDATATNPKHKHHLSLRTKDISPKSLTIISMVVFGLVVYLGLLVGYDLYMRKIESLSLFLGTQMFFDELMALPGGLVAWMSCWLIQFMYLPCLGALIVVGLALVIQWMAIKAYRIPWKLAPLTVLLPVLVISSFTNLGYLIFTLRPAGYALALPVGLIWSLGLFWVYRSVKAHWLRIVMLLVTVVIGYSYLGFYSLLAAAMCGFYHIFCKSDGAWRFVYLAVALLLIASVPRLWFLYVGGNLMESQVYLSGIPYFYSDEWGWWTLYASIFLILVAGAMLSGVHINFPAKPYGIYTGWAVMVALMVTFRYADPDFKLTLQLDRAIWDQDWQKAILISEGYHGPTTRLNTVLSYVPLLRTSQAADRMFTMPYGAEPYRTSRDTRPMHDAAGALVAYHLGLINYAYRWGMEYTIGQSQGVERLKILTKCALLNYELPLAKTYLEILYNTPFHRDWAKKYMRYANHPMEMSPDAELMAVKQLMCQDSRFINDGGAYEAYIWPLLANSGKGTPQFDDLSMQAALLTRDLDTFVSKIQDRASVGGRQPRHYQEAALLWSVLGNKPSPIEIDPMIQNRHQMFLNSFRATSSSGAEHQREALRADFGDTYWFYFIFTEDMAMI